MHSRRINLPNTVVTSSNSIDSNPEAIVENQTAAMNGQGSSHGGQEQQQPTPQQPIAEEESHELPDSDDIFSGSYEPRCESCNEILDEESNHHSEFFCDACSGYRSYCECCGDDLGRHGEFASDDPDLCQSCYEQHGEDEEMGSGISDSSLEIDSQLAPPNVVDLTNTQPPMQAQNPQPQQPIISAVLSAYDCSQRNTTYDHKCKICEVHEIHSVFVPCGHFCCCQICFDQISRFECPMCRSPITDFMNIYF